MSFISTESTHESFNFKNFVRPYSRRWSWFLASILISLISTFVYFRYQVPFYRAQARIEVLDKESSELNVFKDLSILSSKDQSSIADEILLIKSRANLKEVVQRLRLNVRVFSVGSILDSELYKNLPFNIDFNIPDSVVQSSNYRFYLRVSSSNNLGFAQDEHGPFTPYQLGSQLETSIGPIIVTPNYDSFKNLYGRLYRVEILPQNTVAQNYKDRIDIIPSKSGSRVLDLFLADPILIKAKDILSTLISVYNEKTVTNKMAIADRTAEFIGDRINLLSKELSSVDLSAEKFKSERGLLDPNTQANITITKESTYEAELQELRLQLNMAASMKNIIDNNDGYDFLPSNIGLADATITSTVARYNEFVGRRKQLLESSNENNPVVLNLNQQLESLKKNMSASLNSTINNWKLQVNSLGNQIASINSQLYAAPKNERGLRDITRKQETKESLFLYLMEKREEAQIAFASTEPNIRIIDDSYSFSNSPVGLNKKITYVASFLFGLLVPFSVIYIHNLLNTKINSKLELEKLVNDIPVIGELPKLKRRQKKIVRQEDRSVMAEAFRILRTNLDYLLKLNVDTNNKENVVFISSSIANEGKTFVASNLALILANSGKKVVIVGADIRNPKILNFFKENIESYALKSGMHTDKLGLTEYLYRNSIKPLDLIQTLSVNKTVIDVISSGKIPPNPAEILLSTKLESFFDTLSNSYDYVIVDTAPLLAVSDTLSISKYASHLLYVVRAGKTERDVIGFPLKLVKDGKLNNLSFIINGVENSELGYGGKYGYGYSSQKKKKWYQRV